jgi:hypothetical protein
MSDVTVCAPSRSGLRKATASWNLSLRALACSPHAAPSIVADAAVDGPLHVCHAIATDRDPRVL